MKFFLLQANLFSKVCDISNNFVEQKKGILIRLVSIVLLNFRQNYVTKLWKTLIFVL